VTTPARRWAMHKLAPGDWLCWSNDRAQVWRFHQHVDGSALGLIDCGYVERTFWRAIYMPADYFTADPERWLAADRWEPPWAEADWHLPTRQAAVDLMLSGRYSAVTA
jgi:hypothetical protein